MSRNIGLLAVLERQRKVNFQHNNTLKTIVGYAGTLKFRGMVEYVEPLLA